MTLATMGAAAIAAGALIASPAQANQDNWGNPPNVCPEDAYGNCVAATSPQQTVKGTTSLQVFVTCQDAPASGSLIPGTQEDALGPFYQSFAYAADPGALPGSTNYGAYVAWTTGSSVVSGEQVTAVAVDGYANTNSEGAFEVYTWGATPVKVYNAELVGESTTVTFAAGCINFEGETLVGSSSSQAASADAVERRLADRARDMRAALADTAREFASGKRKRAEFQVRVNTTRGVEVHDRINLRSGRAERTTLSCPSGTRAMTGCRARM